MSIHSPLAMKLDVSPPSPPSCRSMPRLSYVHEPNFILHSWSSNGNHVMSILHVLRNSPRTDRQTDTRARHSTSVSHVLRNSPGGTQRQSPVDATTTFVGYRLSKSLSALNTTTRATIVPNAGTRNRNVKNSFSPNITIPQFCAFVQFCLCALCV